MCVVSWVKLTTHYLGRPQRFHPDSATYHCPAYVRTLGP
jgi:hypothetical protein